MDNQNAVLDKKISFQLNRYLFSPHEISMNSGLVHSHRHFIDLMLGLHLVVQGV
jgi:hypothetical protein